MFTVNFYLKVSCEERNENLVLGKNSVVRGEVNLAPNHGNLYKFKKII